MEYLKGIVFTAQTMTPKAHARAMEQVLNDGILSGCTVTGSGTNATIAAGYLCVKGRTIEVASATSITASAAYPNGYGRLVLSLDLTQTSTSEINHQAYVDWEYSSTESFPTLTQEDINGTGTLYQIPLATVRFASGNISTLTQTIQNVSLKETYIASRVLVTNSSGKVAAATTTTTELGYVHGVTSSIQTQLNGKQKTIRSGSSVPGDLATNELFLLLAE